MGDALIGLDVTWPDHTGMDGLGVRATGSLDGAASASQALTALERWVPGLGDSARREDVLHARADRFPYDEVLAHYQVVGRAHAAPEILRRLRYVHDVLRDEPRSKDDARWPLTAWLPSTVDLEDGNYDTYLAAELLEQFTLCGRLDAVEGARPGSSPLDRADDRAIDALVGALVADLALVEAEALLRGRPCREQTRRTRSCLLLLCRLGDLAPTWTDQPRPAAFEAGLAERSDDLRLSEVTRDAATQVWRCSSGECRRVVELARLPITPLHDELMFMRCIQIFENLYRQVVLCLLGANRAVQRADVLGACVRIADATRRLSLSPALYRVLTTMPRASFAIIREYTRGRSAMQSRAYRRIELICAPRPPHPMARSLPDVPATCPTLEESFMALASQGSGPDMELLASRMRALDAGWRAMKRTHWGVTLKTIGEVPGTGGTSGADYLKQTAAVPLFPALAAHG